MKLLSLIFSGIMCLCLVSNTNAQIQTKQAYHSNQTQYSPNALLTPLPQNSKKSQLVDRAIEDYQLLRLDEEILTQLKASKSEQLQLDIPAEEGIFQLQLRRSNPLSRDFKLRMASGGIVKNPDMGVHYRGTIVGQPGTQVALSLMDGELQGMIAKADGSNLVLGPLNGDSKSNDNVYILYQDDPVFATQDFHCETEDSGVDYAPEALEMPGLLRDETGNCVKVYFEVDYNVYQNKGSNAAAYVAAAFNEVAALYTTINIDLAISEILVWDRPSPYGGSSSGTLLTQFQNYRETFNGDIAQLVSYSASGGIAVLSGLCHPNNAARMSFSSIGSTFQTVPTYSWTVMVIAHELGHLLGSQHTHACVWNGNGTAIDGCAGFTEGTCGNPGIPQNGGSIMSYCHLTSAGINFNVAFGAQPGAAIFNFVNAASCTNGDNCNPGPPPAPDTCDAYSVILELTLDHFGPETTWRVEDENRQLLYSGGPYGKKLGGTTVRDTFCLPEACYIFHIMDSDTDGICCNYGNGSYTLIGPEGEIFAEGAEFGAEDLIDFCLPDGPPPTNGEDCVDVNFNTYPVISYGETQDAGQFTVRNSGKELEIRNNAWKAIELPYVITDSTVIEFDFRSTIQGEIHGLGFDDNLNISPEYTFRIYGTQAWGNSYFNHYSGSGEWQHFVIPVGEYLEGEVNYLFFSADHDLGTRNGNSFFRNIKIYQGHPCAENAQTVSLGTAALPSNLTVSPNPVAGNLQFTSPESGTYSVLNMTGQSLLSGEAKEGSQTVPLGDLPEGTYLLRYRSESGKLETVRFTRTR